MLISASNSKDVEDITRLMGEETGGEETGVEGRGEKRRDERGGEVREEGEGGS